MRMEQSMIDTICLRKTNLKIQTVAKMIRFVRWKIFLLKSALTFQNLK